MSAVIRLASATDAAAIRQIYRPIVRDTHISFEQTAPSSKEIAARICRNLILAYRRQQDSQREEFAREAHRRLRPGQDLLTV